MVVKERDDLQLEPQKHDDSPSQSRRLKELSKKLANIKIPSTLTGIAGFGFKVGVFLILKSYLILRNVDLSATGYTMVVSQLALAFVLIAAGITIQDERSAEKPDGLKRTASFYLFGAINGYLVNILSDKMGWKFFDDQTAVNWFVDIFNSLLRGFGEVSMNLLFCDQDFWSFFSLLLFGIMMIYQYSIFGSPEKFFGRKWSIPLPWHR